MSLNTESGFALLTETGFELLAENDTAGQGSDPENQSDNPRLRAHGALRLLLKADIADAPYRKVSMWLKMTVAATLRLGSFVVLKTMSAKPSLKLSMATGAPQPPETVGAQMRILYDPNDADIVLDQYLIVWFSGNPSVVRVALKVDDGEEFIPALTWQNPGTVNPAVVRIDAAAIPGDGLTHRITASVWQQVGSITSSRKSVSVYAKTPAPRTVDQPAWCSATLIRQSVTELGDLTRVEWRHTGAVKVFAKFLTLNAKKTAMIETQATLGYADYDESVFYAESVGLKLTVSPDNVRFGVAAIDRGTFGPIRWAANTVAIKKWAEYKAPDTSPDTPTAQDVTEIYMVEALRLYFVGVMGAAAPANLQSILTQFVYQLKRTLKDVIRKGGSVTLDDCGKFEARWNTENTLRSVAFAPSIGFKVGTREGLIITDSEAKDAAE